MVARARFECPRCHPPPDFSKITKRTIRRVSCLAIAAAAVAAHNMLTDKAVFEFNLGIVQLPRLKFESFSGKRSDSVRQRLRANAEFARSWQVRERITTHMSTKLQAAVWAIEATEEQFAARNGARDYVLLLSSFLVRLPFATSSRLELHCTAGSAKRKQRATRLRPGQARKSAHEQSHCMPIKELMDEATNEIINK